MAKHAHTTSPLLGSTAGALPQLLPAGSGRQPGPVTLAIRAVRRGGAPLPPDWLEDLEGGRAAVLELRKRVADRIEADLALLDALDGNSDFEDGGDLEPSLCGLTVDRPSYLGDDREAGDDNGIADWGGEFDQAQRFIALGGNLNRACRRCA